MSSASETGNRWERTERFLAFALVLLKLHVLYLVWGKPQGYDWGGWLPVLHYTHWFETLPSTRSVAGVGISYHPPLSYLLGRLIFTIYPKEVETSQILSTLSLLLAFFALRSMLKRVGHLYTVHGLWLLYGGLSIPLFVWLGIETCYDGLAFALFALALSTSVALFWERFPAKWWRNLRFTTRLVGLSLVLACVMLTKINGLTAFGLPFLVILVRRGLSQLWREVTAPVAAILVTVVLIGPFYHHHYYLTEHTYLPISMEWDRPSDLVSARIKRDADPAGFVLHMLRFPKFDAQNPQTPELDSFFSLVWLQTWKRDIWLGQQPEPSLSVSNAYSKIFFWSLLSGSAFFLVRRKHIEKPHRDLGLILLGITLVYSVLAVTFGYKYPLWDWRVFKAKYMSASLLYVMFASAIYFGDDWFKKTRPRVAGWIEDAALYGLISFVFINHLLPVY